MAMDAATIERLIKESLPDAQVSIEDLRGDGDHYAAHVVSARVPRQKPGPAAPDGVSGVARPDGQRTARARAADRRARGLNHGALQTRTNTWTPPYRIASASEIGEAPVVLFHEGHAGLPAMRLLGRGGADPQPSRGQVQRHRRPGRPARSARASRSSRTGRRSRSFTSRASSSAAATSSARCSRPANCSRCSKKRACRSAPKPTAFVGPRKRASRATGDRSVRCRWIAALRFASAGMTSDRKHCAGDAVRYSARPPLAGPFWTGSTRPALALRVTTATRD